VPSNDDTRGVPAALCGQSQLHSIAKNLRPPLPSRPSGIRIEESTRYAVHSSQMAARRRRPYAIPWICCVLRTLLCPLGPYSQGSEQRMSDNVFSPGPTPNTVRSVSGEILAVPEGWQLLAPGDAALTPIPFNTSLRWKSESLCWAGGSDDVVVSFSPND